MTPLRIQRRRTRGWKMPANTVSVTRPGKWGNHIVVGSSRGIGYRPWSAEEAVEVYRDELLYEMEPFRPDGAPPKDLSPLRGRNLACWCALCPAHAAGKPLGVECPDCAPCHADYLLEISNRDGYVCD